MLDLDACGEVAEAGAKARRLARARAMGLPVPPGVVVLPGEEIDAGVLAGWLRRLGPGPFVVRSSAQQEDREGRSAAGLLLSRTGVAAAEVPGAVAAVRASGQGEAVRRYLGAPAAVAALVQPQVRVERLGVMMLQQDGSGACEERAADEPEWGAVARRPLGDAEDLLLMEGARALAGLAGGPPVQIEYGRLPGGEVVFFQVRPALAPLHDGDAAWRLDGDALTYELDRGHNPDPLSAAQASLVEAADALCRAEGLGLRQRVVRGYLYAAAVPGPAPDPAALPARFTGEIRPACEALLAPLEARLDVTVEEAVATYLGVFRRYVGQVGPALRRAWQEVDRLLREGAGERLSQHPALLGGVGALPLRRADLLWQIGQAGDAVAQQGLQKKPSPGRGGQLAAGEREGSAAAEDRPSRLPAAGCPPCQGGLIARYLREFGAFAPAWDVAAPCDGEDVEAVRRLAQRVAGGPRPAAREEEARERARVAGAALAEKLGPPFLEWLSVARAALAVGEEDDLLFYRAQAVVRRALLERGRALCRAGCLDAPAQVFDLPIAQAHADVDAARAAAAARLAQARLVPPDSLVAGVPVWAPRRGGAVLRGHGVPAGGGPVRGTARVVRALDRPPADVDGAVLVLPALLPSWVPVLSGAAALVVRSGGALSHGATLAREAGVPAVVGVAGTEEIKDGEELVVDAAAGAVYRRPEQTGNATGAV